MISKFSIAENSVKDKGDGLVTFNKPVALTDTSEQWNGTKYDLKTMDISGWNQLLTADHVDKVVQIVGKVIGLKKVANNRVTIDGIQFAMKNALGALSYNLMTDPNGPFLTDFSIETVGPWPDDDGIYMNSKLVGCSVVVAGNNKNAHINEIALNTIREAEQNGVDTSPITELLKLPIDTEKNKSNNDLDMFKTIKNTRDFAVTLKFKNAAGDEIEKTLNANETIDVSAEQEVALNLIIANAVAPVKKEEVKETKVENGITADALTQAIQAAMKPLQDELAELKTANNSVAEPQFHKALNIQRTNELTAMDANERGQKQIQAALDMLVRKDPTGVTRLNEINKFHLEELKKAKKVANSLTISDFGNFVISPELLGEIEGFRSDFSALMGKLPSKDTLSLQMAWLKRNGDVNMQEVEFCDDGNDGNLKPVSEYDAEFNLSNLKEVAAVTPVCNAATRFLAADLLGDVAAGYRVDYDRKKAQLFVARMQQAVNETGNSVAYDTTSDTHALQSFIGVAAEMQQDVMGGYYILSQKSYWQLMSRQLAAGINTEKGFGLFTNGDMGPLLLGSPYIIVPNELLPTLNTAETRTFIVEGVSVTINQAVFFVDLTTYSGRTSGGLNYDLSTEAAYEVGDVVKSSYQRNELLLRGSFFRGGAIRNVDKVVGLGDKGFS